MDRSSAECRARLSHAERIVSVQADCTFVEALAKMRERAKAVSQAKPDVTNVRAGRLRARWFVTGLV